MKRSKVMIAEHLASAFSLSPVAAKAKLNELAEAGYVAFECTLADGRELFSRTTKGSALAKAKFVKPIPRAKAEALLQGVLERVAEINGSPAFIHSVDRLSVFGSYLSETSELGDIDLIVEDSFKSELGDRWKVTEEHARRSGRRFRNWLDARSYPRLQIEMKIRERSPYLDIQFANQIELLGLKPLTIFERSA
ncbi:hypothetical protein [Defluviimonas sp. WL0075]|nr:hypothetical protein [Defluviimonas sp. WL0075]